jgi:hypothetical protein
MTVRRARPAPASGPEYPVQDTFIEVSKTSAEFENFSDDDEFWLSDLETRAIDLEQELSVLREARERALANQDALEDEAFGAEYEEEPRIRPREAYRRPAGKPVQERHAAGPSSIPTATIHGRGRAQARPTVRPRLDEERTRTLIDRGRPNAVQVRRSRRRRVYAGAVIAAVVAAGVLILVFRQGASWPASVAVVQSEITTACQNPNVASEPDQVNFSCAKDTSQILWVFALMTSGDNPSFTDAKSGRQGLEPITPTQGGSVAWSLNLHHPYNPANPIDSLEVAARAINNIIGGATLTGSNGQPSVQPGLESSPANCARYTGSSAVVTRAGFPDICAQPVTSGAGQAALVADIYSKWLVGSPTANAQDASVLFENASDPGNAQVQAILRGLSGSPT